MSSTSGAASGNFVTQQQPGQWLASRLIGTTVVSANNESIGDVNDVLMDRNGQSVAVVIGVGGFLGIGEKNVAVPFAQLDFTSRAAGGSATGTASGGTATSGSTASGNTATTGSTTAPGGAASTSASSSSDAPERITLRMSKQDLQNAPQFTRAGATGSGGGSSTGTGGGAGSTGASGTAPRQ